MQLFSANLIKFLYIYDVVAIIKILTFNKTKKSFYRNHIFE